MHTFEKMINSEKPVPDHEEKQTGIDTSKNVPTDDFGQILIPKASSPFETKQSAKKVINPNQKSLQGFLKDNQRDKVVRKAAMLYSSFKKHCAQNKIDPSLFTGVSK